METTTPGISQLKRQTEGLSLLYLRDHRNKEEETGKLLSMLFASATIVDRPEEALAALSSAKPDLLLADLDDGAPDFFRRVVEQVPHLPLILAVDSQAPEKLVELIRAGAHHFLTRPLEKEQLFRALYQAGREIHLARNSSRENRESLHLLEEYRNAVDVSNILSVTDPAGVITYVNDEFCRISRYPREELIGKPHNIVRHPEMPKEAFADLWATIKAKKVWKGVVKNLAKDGSVYIVDATIVPIVDNDGELVEYVGIRKDITDLVEREQQLRRSAKLLEEYKKAVDAGSIVSKTDVKGNITYVNDRFCAISGYAREELIGKPHNIVRHPEMPSDAFADLWATIKAKQVWSGTVQNRKKDGDSYYVEATVVPILDENGEAVEYIGIRTDITDRIHQERELEKLRFSQMKENVSKALSIAMEEMVENVPLPALFLDGADRVVNHNRRFTALFDRFHDQPTLEALENGSLVFSDLFLPAPEGDALEKDPIFDWKEALTLEGTFGRLRISCGGEPREFRLSLKGMEGKEREKRFMVCLVPEEEES